MSKNTVRITYTGDAAGLRRATSQAEGHLHKLGSTGSRVFGSIGKAAGLAAGLGGVIGFGLAARAAVQEYAQAARVGAQTNAVIKSTGGAANVTAKHVDNLATSIMNYSGMDDEAVKAGENMLLTFRDIQNHVGKNNKIFDQATKVTADLSVAMGMDMSKAALQVGKALNDPEKGMTRLQRIGVTFTDQQKNLVKHLVATGDTVSAQKVILAELTKEFGGSAAAAGKTLPGQLKILKENLSNVGGEIVAGLVPALSKGTQWLVGMLPTFREWGQSLTEAVGPAIGEISNVIAGAFPRIRQLINSYIVWWKANLLPIWKDLAAIVMETFHRIAVVVESHRAELTKLFENIGTIVKNLWAVAGPILKLLFEEVLPRAIGVAIVVLEKVSTVIAGVSTAWRKAITFILTMVDKLLGGFQFMAEAASHIPFIGKKFDGVADAIGRVRAKVQGLRQDIENVHGKKVVVDVALKFSGATDANRSYANKDGLMGAIGDGAAGYVRSNPFSIFPAGGGAGAGGLQPYIRDELGIGQAMGLRLTSGVRPGAVTSTGHRSLHATGQAIDMAGTPALMAAYASTVAGRSGIAEVIYSGPGGHGGWYPGVGWTWGIPSSVLNDHRDHVHVGARSGDGLIGDGLRGRKRQRRNVPPGWRARARRQASKTPWGQLPAALELAIFDAEGTPGSEDDVAAHQRALAFFQGQLRWVRRYKLGPAAELDVKRAIRGEEQALRDAQGGSDADLQAQLEQANRRLSAAELSAGLANAYVATGGALGGGGDRVGGGGGGQTVVFASLIPDAEQTRRAAAAIAQGMGAQPHRTPTQEHVGL